MECGGSLKLSYEHTRDHVRKSGSTTRSVGPNVVVSASRVAKSGMTWNPVCSAPNTITCLACSGTESTSINKLQSKVGALIIRLGF